MKHLLATLILFISIDSYCQSDSVTVFKKGYRYFFVGFDGTTKEEQSYSGGIDYISNAFVNLNEARKFIANKLDLKIVYVTAIYEFKSVADYRRFWKNNIK